MSGCSDTWRPIYPILLIQSDDISNNLKLKRKKEQTWAEVPIFIWVKNKYKWSYLNEESSSSLRYFSFVKNWITFFFDISSNVLLLMRFTWFHFLPSFLPSLYFTVFVRGYQSHPFPALPSLAFAIHRIGLPSLIQRYVKKNKEALKRMSRFPERLLK